MRALHFFRYFLASYKRKAYLCKVITKKKGKKYGKTYQRNPYSLW